MDSSLELQILLLSVGCFGMVGWVGGSEVFLRCWWFLWQTAPFSISMVKDCSSSLVVTWALGKDLLPSLKGFILMTSPSGRLGRSLAVLVWYSILPGPVGAAAALSSHFPGVHVLGQKQALGCGKRCFCSSAHQLLCHTSCHSLGGCVSIVQDNEVWVCSSLYQLPQ